jgi:hypothetical protein
MQTIQNAYESLLNLFVINADEINTANLSVDNLSLPTLTPSLPLQLDSSNNVISSSINLSSNQVSGVLPIINSQAQVEYITGTLNRIDISGPTATPNIDISSNYSGQTSITILGPIGTGSWLATSISTTYTDAKVESVTGTINRISITGTINNPIVDISNGYTGQNSISNIGTITNGVWNGSSISTTYTDAKVESVTGTTNRISVTGTINNPIVDISSVYTGQNTISNLGTISNGIWQATPIDGTYINYNTNNLKVTSNQLNTVQDIGPTSNIIFNTIDLKATTNQIITGTGTNLTTSNYPASSGAVTLTFPNTTSTIATVQNTVSSLSGTANEILLSGGPTGAITLSTPQPIATTSDVTFGSVLADHGTFTDSLNPQIILNGKFLNYTKIYAPVLNLADPDWVVSFPNVAGASLSSSNFVLDSPNVNQTINGIKTFSSPPILSSLTASSLLALDASKNITNTTSGISPTFTTLTAATVLTNALDRASAGTLNLGTGTATTITVGKSGVTTTLPGTTNLSGLSSSSLLALDGSKNITNSTSGLIVTFDKITGTSYLNTPTIDTIGATNMNIATANATSISIGQSGVSTTLAGTTNLSVLTAKGLLGLDASKNITSTTLTDGQLLIGSTGNVPTAATLIGTANEITVTNGGGTITLSTPQVIGTTGTPTFSKITLSNTTNQIVLGTTNTTTLSATAPSTSRTITFPDPGATGNVIYDVLAQTISAQKTFTLNPIMNGLSATSLVATDGSKVLTNTTSGITPTFNKLIVQPTLSGSGVTAILLQDSGATKQFIIDYDSTNSLATLTAIKPGSLYAPVAISPQGANQGGVIIGGTTLTSGSFTTIGGGTCDFTTTIIPTTDNTYNLGSGSKRWGTVFAAVGTINTSDESEKNNIQNCDLGVDFINSLIPRKYNLKKSDNNENHYGIIAQELKQTIDNLNISFAGYYEPPIDEPDSLKGINYSELISPIIKSIQQLDARLKIVENKLNGGQ